MMQAAAIPAASISAAGRLRIAVRLLAMAMLLIACVPLYYLFRLLPGRNPWPRVFLGGIAWLAGVDLRVSGTRVTCGEFLIANHVSWIDIPAIASASGAAFVAHDGLAAMPFVRWLCAMNDTVFVARHERTTIAQQVEQVRAALRDTGALAIFPEGTTSDGVELLPFKSALLSAFEPLPENIAVQPVLLDYGRDAAEIAWVGDEHGMDNFLRILSRARPIELNVRFLPPLTGDALANRKTIASAARVALIEAMAG